MISHKITMIVKNLRHVILQHLVRNYKLVKIHIGGESEVSINFLKSWSLDIFSVLHLTADCRPPDRRFFPARAKPHLNWATHYVFVIKFVSRPNNSKTYPPFNFSRRDKIDGSLLSPNHFFFKFLWKKFSALIGFGTRFFKRAITNNCSKFLSAQILF